MASDAQTAPATRSPARGIFDVPVYRAKAAMHAAFDAKAMEGLVPQGATVHWDQAQAAIRLSDSHGLADNVALMANGHPVAFGPGVSAADGSKSPASRRRSR